ncbi:TonB-dependent receptor domain-containing protein [Sphingomonas quercus]|nr:TonB-dependent receptor [Sphingomonas quercus]
MAGALPQFHAPPLRGSMGVAAALRRLLAGSGWRAVQVGASAYRIERAPQTARRPATPEAREPAEAIVPGPPLTPDIVVTGQKRALLLQDVAMSVSIVPLDGQVSSRFATSSRDLSLSVEGLAVTNLGPGRNRQFIRGVADSPFNGPSQSTVAVQLDEVRITFDAPDPDIRLVDMERVEILKGPQGPLYGSGALGGIYHMVSRKPDLTATSGSMRIISEAVEHGSPGAGGEAVLNLPLVADSLAVRGVGYVTRSGGWIDNLGRNRNANVTQSSGGRLAARWQPDPDWTIDLSGVVQNMNSKDSQYVTASDETVHRNARVPEPTDNDFKSAAATIQGRIGAFDLLATTSYVDHRVGYQLDSSDASEQFGLRGQSTYRDDRKYTILNHELRLSPAGSSLWLAGLSFMQARSHNEASMSSAMTTVAVESLDRKITEFAAFGELTMPLIAAVKATAGARLFRSIAEDEAVEQAGGSSDRIVKTFLSPSLAVSWTPGKRSILYLRYARGLRPGGLAPLGQSVSRRFDSDELGTFDLGIRHTLPGSSLSLGASLFHTSWSHIQSDYLLPNGLISTRNAGKGRIYGIETTAEWRPLTGVTLSAGGSYLHARLVSTEAGLEVDDRRLPIAPDATGRLAAQYDFALGSWATSLSAQANYVGRSRLTFDENLDREMGNYTTASLAAFLRRNRVTIGARIDNLLDVKGDSFAFGNPFSIARAPQYTPLRPRTFTLSLARTW